MRILALIITGLLLTAAPAAAVRAPFSLFPVVGGAHYTDDFGDGRPGGSHQGNDLLAPCGSPVVAVVPGTVTMLSWGDTSGWILRLEGRRSWYYYIHLDGRGGKRTAFARGLRVGEHVAAGRIIGYVGNTGDAAGGPCHLHFEYHRGDRAFSPYRYLEQARVLQFDEQNPLSFNAVARRVSLRITGVVSWVATARDGGRLILRPESIATSDGSRVGHAGTVALRIPADLVDDVSVGTMVTVRTVPMAMTTALQDVAPYTWTVATIR